MWQAVVLLGMFLFVTLFSVQNMHQTRINFPLAGGFEITTMFLLILCFFLGFAAASILWLTKQIKRRKDAK